MTANPNRRRRAYPRPDGRTVLVSGALVTILAVFLAVGHTLAGWSTDATLTDHRVIADTWEPAQLEIEIDVRQTLHPDQQGQVMVDLLAIAPFDPMEIAGDTLRFGPHGRETAQATYLGQNLTGTNHPRTDRVRRAGFPVADTGLRPDDAGCVIGELHDGTHFAGCTQLRYAPGPEGTSPSAEAEDPGPASLEEPGHERTTDDPLEQAEPPTVREEPEGEPNGAPLARLDEPEDSPPAGEAHPSPPPRDGGRTSEASEANTAITDDQAHDETADDEER